MTIEEFTKKYREKPKKINEIIRSWIRKKEVDDFLGTQILGSYTIGDLLIGDGLTDAIPSNLKEAFSGLMKEKADSYQEIRKIILEKDKLGDESVIGMINKIQGQLGENLFIENAGNKFKLAASGSQEAYDILGIKSGEYIQIKVYDDADAVIEKIQEVNEKVASGLTDEFGNKIDQIDFAVNSDIYEEVIKKAEDLGLPNKILNLGSDRDEIRNIIENSFDAVANPGITDFFSELFGGTLTMAAIHGAINGFFLWKGAKEKQQAFEDTLYSSVISTGGLSVTLLLDIFLLEGITGIIGGPILLISGIGVRTVLKRFTNKRFIIKRLIEGNTKLANYCVIFS